MPAGRGHSVGQRGLLGPNEVLPRNDVRQYDQLVDAWSDPDGMFAMLFWLASARAELVPPAGQPGQLLVDVACGGGLFAPHARHLGYRHLGLDLSASALGVARAAGVLPVQADAAALPLPDACADVVLAGEVLEHVADTEAVVAEVCRVLRPGGTVVLDTIADTAYGRFSSITVAERIPGGPPPGIHDPALFVNRGRLRDAFGRGGVPLELVGLRLPPLAYLRWAWGRSRQRRGGPPFRMAPLPAVRLQRTRFTGGLFQGVGTKACDGRRSEGRDVGETAGVGGGARIAGPKSAPVGRVEQKESTG